MARHDARRSADSAIAPAEATATMAASRTPSIAGSAVGMHSTGSSPHDTESRTTPATKRDLQSRCRSERWRSRRNIRPSTRRAAVSTILIASHATSSGCGTLDASSRPVITVNANPPNSSGSVIA